MEKILAQFQGMTGKDFFGANFVMNEVEFEKMQKQFPWTMQASMSLSKKQQSRTEQQLDFWESLSLISCFIFGAMGIEKNVEQAGQMISDFIPSNVPVEQVVPYIAHFNILRGTIAVYKSEYIKASYYFLAGMKLGTNLSTPYCDFIRHILEKIMRLPSKESTYKGIGHDVKQPMGSTKK